MPRHPTIRQSDVTRALKAAAAAGISVQRYEIDAAGKIVVFAGEPVAQSNPTDAYEAWRAKKDARRAEGRS
jgi:hypothetical protein